MPLVRGQLKVCSSIWQRNVPLARKERDATSAIHCVQGLIVQIRIGEGGKPIQGYSDLKGTHPDLARLTLCLTWLAFDGSKSSLPPNLIPGRAQTMKCLASPPRRTLIGSESNPRLRLEKLNPRADDVMDVINEIQFI